MEKTIYQTDSSWLTQQDDGSHHLEIADEYDRDGETRFAVFGVDLERFAEVRDPATGRTILLSKSLADKYKAEGKLYEPLHRYDEWFVKDLRSVASSAGTTERALRKQLCSADPKQRARAYEDIAGYHGWENFDSYPQDMSEDELNARWAKREGAGGKGRKRRARGAGLVAASHQHHQRMDRATRPAKPARVDALAAAVAKLTR